MTVRRPGRSRPRKSNRYTRRLLRALLELHQLLRTPQPLDTLLQAILDTALDCVPGAQRGSLLVLEGDRLCYRAVRGYNLGPLRAVSFPVDQVQSQFLESQTRQIRDFAAWDAEHLDERSNAVLREHGHIEQIRRSLLCSIYVGGHIYGALVLDNLRDHSPYRPDAEDLARIFAEQAGTLLEQALLLEQVHQTSTMLVEAEKLAALGRFIASIAHEINNPLTAVLGYADFLAASDLRPEAQALLAQLKVGAERVRTIVRNLQLYSRQQQSGTGQMNLNLLVEQTLTLKGGDLRLDQIDVQLRLDPDLPFSWGDSGQLSQVLLNLIVNAQHALQQVPPPRKLLVSTDLVGEAAEPLLILQVADNGPGVPRALAERIFEPFFTTKPAGQGTGLGLSICQGIVQAHGGKIRVAATAGGGATFVVELPLRYGPKPSVQPAAAPPAPPRPEGRRILLTEDDPAVVSAVLMALGEHNRVEVAANGFEALRLAAAQSFDLALCDLRMPEMDGLELFERLRAAHPALAGRVLFISGDTNSAVTRAALELTERPLLTKPFTPEELFRAIAAL
jgi:signal transduction histidine kinase/CheY-like chemotaxis protein